MTKDPTPTENSKKEGDNTKTPPKTSITQRLRTGLGRPVKNTTAIQLVWLNVNKRLTFPLTAIVDNVVVCKSLNLFHNRIVNYFSPKPFILKKKPIAYGPYC